MFFQSFRNLVSSTQELQKLEPYWRFEGHTPTEQLEDLKARGDKIIFTRDTHPANYLETNEGKHLPIEHCIRKTYGWEIAEGLVVDGSNIIDKPTFGYVYWDSHIGLEEVEEIEIAGLCSDICVISNALILKATFPEANITVDASCCAGVTPESHQAALTTMKMCQINVIGE